MVWLLKCFQNCYSASQTEWQRILSKLPRVTVELQSLGLPLMSDISSLPLKSQVKSPAPGGRDFLAHLGQKGKKKSFKCTFNVSGEQSAPAGYLVFSPFLCSALMSATCSTCWPGKKVVSLASCVRWNSILFVILFTGTAFSSNGANTMPS